MDENKVRAAFKVAHELALTTYPESYGLVFSAVFLAMLQEPWLLSTTATAAMLVDEEQKDAPLP